ncbi:MAG: PIN domain-containing protein [Polyangiales bacterium]
MPASCPASFPWRKRWWHSCSPTTGCAGAVSVVGSRADGCRPRFQARGKLIADAYHAALAIEHGCEWATVDGDFARFPHLRWTHPLPPLV